MNFTERNFAPVDFIDKNDDIQPMFSITRDGYMMLNDRKKEKRLLAIEEEQIKALSTPDMVAIMQVVAQRKNGQC